MTVENKNKTLLDQFAESPQNQLFIESEKLIIDVALMIEDLMKEKDINKTQLAKKLGVSQSSISQFLDGRRNMTLRTISELLFNLGERLLVSSESLDIEAKIFDYSNETEMIDLGDKNTEWIEDLNFYNKSDAYQSAA